MQRIVQLAALEPRAPQNRQCQVAMQLDDTRDWTMRLGRRRQVL